MGIYEWAMLWVGSVGLAYFIGVKWGHEMGENTEKLRQSWRKFLER